MEPEGAAFMVGVGSTVYAEVVQQEGKALMAGEGGGIGAEDV